MSEYEPRPLTYEEVRRRTLNLYDSVTVLMLIGIAILVIYCLSPQVTGQLTAPGPQESFGFAIALMSLMGAVLFHIVDRTYRVWPLGRRITPPRPTLVTNESVARLLRIVVVAAAGAGIAYLLAGVIVG